MTVRNVSIVVIAVFAILQLVPVERGNPPVTQNVAAPTEIAAILTRACYDCHSNATAWPWYSKIAPISFLVVHDVNEGREHLNFSTWNVYNHSDIAHIAEELEEVMAEQEMPLWFYVPLHPEAKLSDADRSALSTWARTLTAPTAPTNDNDHKSHNH